MTTTPPSDNDQQGQAKQGKTYSFAPRAETISAGTREAIQTDRQRKYLRYLLLGAVLITASIGVSFISLTEHDDIKIKVEQTIKDETNELVLEGVTYKGLTSEGNDFIVLAETAAENPDQPDQIKLTSPRARVDTDSGNPMTIRSNNGLFFRNDDRVDLDGRVVIVRPDLGYTLLTEQAQAFLDTGMMTSDVLVRGFSPQGQVTADGMVIKDHGQDVLFKGKSVLTLKQN